MVCMCNDVFFTLNFKTQAPSTVFFVILQYNFTISNVFSPLIHRTEDILNMYNAKRHVVCYNMFCHLCEFICLKINSVVLSNSDSDLDIHMQKRDLWIFFYIMPLFPHF